MLQLRQALPLVLALLVTGSDGPVPKPLDGGFPIDFEPDRWGDDIRARDPMWRREMGGWHYSAGHVEPMSPRERMTGVWVTAFEESSFFPGATTLPDPNDPIRSTQQLELDAMEVYRLAGPVSGSADGEAYLLTFIGRRSRDPYHVDCTGTPYFGVVVYRLISARRLGPMGPFSAPEMMARAGRVERRHGGRWGELEARAIARCAPSRERGMVNGG